MITNNEIKIYPAWFTKQEDKDGLDEIRHFIRKRNLPVGALIIEKDSFFIQAEVNEITQELKEAAYEFNSGSHKLFFDFEESDRVGRGEAFHV